MKFYIIKESKGINATAEYDINSHSFTVLRNSRVSNFISNAPTFEGAKTIRKYREKYVINCIVNENIVFKSSSSAGNFVTGTSTNGPSTWKDQSGKSLKVFLSEMKK